MKKITKQKELTELEQIIKRNEDTLLNMDPKSKEYATVVENLDTLYSIKKEEKGGTISKEAIAGIVANLLGIGLILGHERLHVISTKALGFVFKRRL